VIVEASAVEARGRISPQDSGIYLDEHVEPFRRITRFIHEQGAIAGIQIAHAGRKASTSRPWDGDGPLSREQGGWDTIVAPSPIAFADKYPVPIEINEVELKRIVQAFGKAAERAFNAGFKFIEIHAAHGYLLHEFLSPLTNLRNDGYGGSFLNRTRIIREVVDCVRKYWPDRLPLFIRISATDWLDGGWDAEQSVELARQLKTLGVDLFDCSSGGLVPNAIIPVGSGFQTIFAKRIRKEANILSGAVGFITSPQQADTIVRTGQADMVLLAREFLRDPYWPMRAARELHQDIPSPLQYVRAWGK
jgi:2,4-dienoyl-CoA reductase-like NADH-dependent reductase (Old Yellow Enzyme family)